MTVSSQMKELKLTIYQKYFFKYLVLDNFLDENDFQFLSNRVPINQVPPDRMSEFVWYIIDPKANKISSLKGGIKDAIPIPNLKSMHTKYSPILDQILFKLSPLKSHLIDRYDYQLTVSGKDYKYQIHDDVPHKLLSTVIYLYPEDNFGTFLHSSLEAKEGFNPSNTTGIKWKKNRAFIFPRINKKTWHSFQGDGKSNRLTLVINVSTNRIDEVNEIERSEKFLKTITFY